MNSTDSAGTSTKGSPTIIEIATGIDAIFDSDHAYYGRTALAFFISSSRKFDRIVVTHLGFKSWQKGKRDIKRKGDRYVSNASLMPDGGAQVEISSLGLTLVNVGDGFLQVNIRLPIGVKRCKMTILQEGKRSREVDNFVKIGDVSYTTATINAHQRLVIEEEEEECA